MTENRIKKVRQFCISVMMLCLAFLGVFLVQERTGLQKVSAETSSRIPGGIAGDNELVQMGEAFSFGGGHAETEVKSSAWSKIFGSNLPEAVKQQGDACVLIRKQGAVVEQISEEMIYRKVTVSLRGTLTKEDVYRVSGESLYSGEPDVPVVMIPEEEKDVPLIREPKTAEEDVLLSLDVSEKDGRTEVVLEFHTVYEVTVTEDEEFLYFSLVRPCKKYDKIIVLDAGHGGNDPGTSGGGVTEASINLAVVQYAKELLDQRKDWKVYYTRLSDVRPSLSERVEFANALHADMVISVHCNHNPVSAVNGVKTLYSKVQGQGETFNSKSLAEFCGEYVAEETGLRNGGLEERSGNLHIIKYCTMPMTLIEFGYMSNQNDLALIKTEEAQRNCARAIYRTIEAAYELLKK